MDNITLIGMPGSGKSTIGRIIADALGKELIDADARIVEKAGCTIPEIFANQGEAAFRAIETAVLEEIGKLSGKVIATGGGCVTRPENYSLLHQNGHIFWLQREISLLPTDGRPLSQSTKLVDMYRIRKPLYAQFADHSIDSNQTPKDAASDILKIWEES